ncbi:MAG TPA: SigE family RNA polymerase sigma factor [Streptosporangiaceae bacterium]|jgi:RNA polymerase sigma-70 factor (sigma-E family)|nr:SigE family RNA polymerase sigma factor [Streptosporangiaceae bacterium]
METASPGRSSAASVPSAAGADAFITALYAEHALGLVRLAFVMLGDRPAAEDVVQDAFLGLYRHWGRLADPAKALAYARSSVLNGCRSVLRHQRRHVVEFDSDLSRTHDAPSAESSDSGVLLGEEHAQVLAAIRRLPGRQREAVILRFYLDMPELDAAAAMGISRGTIKSATSRGVAALARMLKEES